MKKKYIYSVFNSSNHLLCTFFSIKELKLYIKRNCRDMDDTTILRTVLNSWGEMDNVDNITKEVIDEVYRSAT